MLSKNLPADYRKYFYTKGNEIMKKIKCTPLPIIIEITNVYSQLHDKN